MRGNKLTVADVELDPQQLSVTRAGQPVDLTPQEFALLKYLMKHAGKLLTREMILQKVWKYPTDVSSRVVDVYIGYLRKKIDRGFSTKLIHSIRGKGYILAESE